ncbi:hypothetical protein CONCODRAFT_10329 [Conidiobolus coronatus NRRL 28638]|uniref:Uncharacterized protein n=1 Tax=Conidiobolus coronatus (strain ATCC 28846 / CBS 209.66 / NRRL 28638) TaxID=796925 RepID=A0A137NXX4_CONC2|nr:hypothetical protein CONCODRAFT_10329 [Conidiobolus coronatus NRRL 28638]|eukprot:KXN67597.1 hypothetical protein CONCODRAFT_10329 [Conidiobolus coronatus NRRL 28638]
MKLLKLIIFTITSTLGLSQFKLFNSYSKTWTLNGEFIFSLIVSIILVGYTIYSNQIKLNNGAKFSFIKQKDDEGLKWNLNPYDWLANLYTIGNRYLSSGPFTLTVTLAALSIFFVGRIGIFIGGFFINLNLFAYSLFDLSLFGFIINIISVVIIRDLVKIHFNLVNDLLYQSVGSDNKNELDIKLLTNNLNSQLDQVQIQTLVQLKREIYFNKEFRKQIYQAIAPEFDPSATKLLFTKISKEFSELNRKLSLDGDKLKKENNKLAVYALDNCNCVKLTQFKPILSYACKACTLLKSVTSPVTQTLTNLLEKSNVCSILCKSHTIIKSTLGPAYSQHLINLYQDYITLKTNWSVKDPLFNLKVCLCPMQKFILSISVISDLIHHSAKEDNYGLVQYEVPKLIELLLFVYDSLDKISKIKDELSLERVKILQPLIIELERGINRILIEYGKVYQTEQLPSNLKNYSI